ncbi:MAG: putative sugar nucleotidyl transferase [Melioribacter sp.]|jgi:UDP-N-acetylglucosamine diphosphorylase/glucosamine-1-phosphate N-acetyltransferase|uniref:putative sugar nucleotidyl transferase n=1 Tax=Melioribacter sp. TaxID=2052167 RepID=UPI003BBE9CB6
MKKIILIFEDTGFRDLLPLSYLRPVYELRTGIFSLLSKIEYSFAGSEIYLTCRKYLEENYREKKKNYRINLLPEAGEALMINGRVLMNRKLRSEISKLQTGEALVSGKNFIAGIIDADNLKKIYDSDFLPQFDNFKFNEKEIETELIQYPWELINYNGKEIETDFKTLLKYSGKIKTAVHPKFKKVELQHKKSIHIGKDVKIEPFVFIDASDGPVYIDENVHIMSNSMIKGPAFIGRNSIIKANSTIYHGASIGKYSKVGGEVEDSIIQSYSNKQHGGFLGHSYLGSWVNLGAGTNNSDLKNNYGGITVNLNNKKIDTGLRFLGLIMGDHSKSAIGTKFNTGTICGVMCNVFGNGFPPKFIPSFTWGCIDEMSVFDIDKSIELARIVTARRNVEFTESDEKLLRKVFELSEIERKY